MKKAFLPLVGTFFAALMATSMSFALPITGSLDFSGGVLLDGTSLSTATKVLNWSSVAVTNGGVTAGSTLDTTINPGDSVTMSFPWSFNSGMPALWTVGGFTFNLGTSSVIFQDSEFLTVKGFGLIVGNGYDPTPATWYFTSQGQGLTDSNFSFSATTLGTRSLVPDSGATALLFSAAFCGLALTQRFKRRGV